MENHPVAIVAGGGQFPLLCARAIRQKGHRVFAVAHKGETDAALEDEVDDLVWVHLGQLGKVIKSIKKAGAKEAIFAGTITKKRMFRDVRPDLKALALWKRLNKRLDDSILRAVASEIEAEGIKVVGATEYLTHLLAPKGVLTRKNPARHQWEDISFGWRLAKEIGRRDIGQCVVVKDRAVIAVEANEGTDRTISRGGELGGPGTVVVKVCKPNQDTRFDLPSIGIGTVESMKAAGASVLAFEAGKALLFDKEETIKLADKFSISLVGIDDGVMPGD